MRRISWVFFLLLLLVGGIWLWLPGARHAGADQASRRRPPPVPATVAAPSAAPALRPEAPPAAVEDRVPFDHDKYTTFLEELCRSITAEEAALILEHFGATPAVLATLALSSMGTERSRAWIETALADPASIHDPLALSAALYALPPDDPRKMDLAHALARLPGFEAAGQLRAAELAAKAGDSAQALSFLEAAAAAPEASPPGALFAKQQAAFYTYLGRPVDSIAARQVFENPLSLAVSFTSLVDQLAPVLNRQPDAGESATLSQRQSALLFDYLDRLVLDPATKFSELNRAVGLQYRLITETPWENDSTGTSYFEDFAAVRAKVEQQWLEDLDLIRNYSSDLPGLYRELPAEARQEFQDLLAQSGETSAFLWIRDHHPEILARVVPQGNSVADWQKYLREKHVSSH